jgi:uncharacterized protein with NRDE domain
VCTVVILHRPNHAWPLLLGANRDEMLARPTDPPGAHWPDRPDLVAGRDREAGGTWLGLNRYGLVAAVLNRPGSLGPAPGKRSRGELPLLALEHATAEDAVAALADLDGRAWRSFNMVIADAAAAWFIAGPGGAQVRAEKLAAARVHMITSHDPDDMSSPRVARHLPQFEAASVPRPPDDWRAWRDILTDSSGPPESQICVAPTTGFGTVSLSLLALPARGPAVWWYQPRGMELTRVR